MIVGMLAWFNEQPERLDACVRSFAPMLDRLVAVDGGYEQRPGAKARSPAGQMEAIVGAASLPVRFIQPATVWSGQVAKRQAMMEHAVTEGANWVIPIDADWFLTGDAEGAKEEITGSQAEALRIQFYTPENPDADTREIAPHPWHVQTAGTTHLYPFIYRVLRDMRVGPRHWSYSGGREDGTRVYYWGDGPPAKMKTLESDVTIEHRCFFRDEASLEANRAFCAARDQHFAQTGVER